MPSCARLLLAVPTGLGTILGDAAAVPRAPQLIPTVPAVPSVVPGCALARNQRDGSGHSLPPVCTLASCDSACRGHTEYGSLLHEASAVSSHRSWACLSALHSRIDPCLSGPYAPAPSLAVRTLAPLYADSVLGSVRGSSDTLLHDCSGKHGLAQDWPWEFEKGVGPRDSVIESRTRHGRRQLLLKLGHRRQRTQAVFVRVPAFSDPTPPEVPPMAYSHGKNPKRRPWSLLLECTDAWAHQGVIGGDLLWQLLPLGGVELLAAGGKSPQMAV